MSHLSTGISFPSQGAPLVEKGLGTDTVWFGGGRVGVKVASHGGLERLVYYGRQPMNHSAFYAVDARSAYAKLFKVYLMVEEKAYRMELNQTRLYPGGYTSRFSVPEDGIKIEHDLVLVNDAVLQTVRVLSNRKKKTLRLRISWHEHTGLNPSGRTWGPWSGKVARNAWTRQIADKNNEGQGTTWLGVIAEQPLTTKLTRSGRRFFETAPIRGKESTVTVLFGGDKKTFLRRAATLAKGGSRESSAMIAGWDKRLDEVPRVKLGLPAVESFFQISPVMMESLMPTDLTGAMRASAGSYWVWGWDTLVHVDAYLAAGQHGFVKEALEIYHRTAHPTKGVGHQFDIEMNVKIAQAPAAQGLYAYALYQYVAATGDKKVLRQHYPIALAILKLALASRQRDGFFTGNALFPDYPEDAGHNGHDISVFNNFIFYQAARTIEQLAGWMGDAATAKMARKVWQDLLKAFHHLWDAKRGFWYDSIDSRDLSPRPSYPSHAILCFSPFSRELLAGKEEAAARFMNKELVFEGGIRMHALLDPSFNGDGNQFGQHYPVGSDLLLLKIGAETGRQATLKQWLGWIDLLWRQNTIPEGVTVEAENEGPLYPDEPGGKQPFSSKAWYMGILDSLVGVHFDVGGATLGAGLDRAVEASGLYFQGRRWTVRAKGQGKYIHQIRVNGKSIRGTCKIPAEAISSKAVIIEVTRGTKALPSPQLLSADGAKLSKWKNGKKGFSVQIEAPGSIVARFQASRKLSAKWEGKPVTVAYDKRTGVGQILLACDKYQPFHGTLSVESV